MFFFLPAEGCVEVLLVGVFSVTLKSRPTMEWFAKAKNSRKEKNKGVEHGDACVFWDYSGSVR